MTKVSVIVPIYNVYNYIEGCLESLNNQTLDDIEFILVNDGSKENEEEIIEKYLKDNKKFKYFKKENGGISDARNYGLKYATGEYITFLDSDDYVSYDMYERMYEKAKSGNFDMVVCDLNYVYADKVVKAYSNVSEDTKNIKKTMLDIYPAVWNKLFKRNLFESGIRFKKNVWFEDVEFLYRLLPFIRSIGVIHEHFNQYLQRSGSITNTINKKIYDYIDNWNGIVEYYKEKKMYEEFKKELEYCYVRYIFATFIKQASKYSYDDYMEAVSVAIKNVLLKFPNYRKNKYFYQSLKGLYLIAFSKLEAEVYYKIRKRDKSDKEKRIS